MKKLNEILGNVEVLKVSGDLNREVSELTFDSRNIVQDCVFFAIDGVLVDGHKYIEGAVKAGAGVIVYDNKQTPVDVFGNATAICVADSKKELGVIASSFYNNPSSKLKLVGVTGTNGKTTVATQLYSLFELLGKKSGLFSTIKIMSSGEEVNSTHTTPDPITLNSFLSKMVNDGVEYCFMEVSSHGIDQQRISGLEFAGGVFTNITHDHLDYHKTFKEYIRVKKVFFDGLSSSAFALTNVDDRNGNIMLQNTKARKLSYSLKSVSDYSIKIVESHFDGMQLLINKNEIWTHLIGKFNAYNLLAIYGVAIELGMQELDVMLAISKLTNVSGRFDYFISKSGIITVVDYAHTPDALQNVLSTIAEIRNGNEKLITVVGCGGDRDKDKRPKMARISCELSDKVIITSDNPRTEKPEEIIKDMEAGVTAEYYNKTVSIIDREQGIKAACQNANAGDIILIAGKGHETYQEIMGVRYNFDDSVKAKEILNLLNK
ncbi:MAG: UDP-N-acetylmuramoyl-L-alanyl-D-glutamate--2,6-diaminopimelate ligase [Ichthyobacteriaceae bacterium]|nr:UDP-N-acetylmuramoyl-L-alanyl-D-glutamate--2,6-diaminopimelate ligase [Ichthyobacteriaceae bacterium]